MTEGNININMNIAEQWELIAFALHVADWADDCDLEIEEVLKRKDTNVFKSWESSLETKKHSGDCTNEIHMCLLCHREWRFEQARFLLEKFQQEIKSEHSLVEKPKPPKGRIIKEFEDPDKRIKR